MKSWRTTVVGICVILVAIATAIKAALDGDSATVADWGAAVAEALAGLGMIFARDNDKSSEEVGATK